MARIKVTRARTKKNGKSKGTAQELTFFDLRNGECCLEECAELINISVSTVKRINKKMKEKIIRIL